jgi:hypothetical protein
MNAWDERAQLQDIEAGLSMDAACEPGISDAQKHQHVLDAGRAATEAERLRAQHGGPERLDGGENHSL